MQQFRANESGLADDAFWKLTSEDKQRYDKIFTFFDKTNRGKLLDSEMQEVMEQTKLPKEICGQVWDISNPTGEEMFTKPMFMVAMHLMYKKKKDEAIQLPRAFPLTLLESAGIASSGQPVQYPFSFVIQKKLTGRQEINLNFDVQLSTSETTSDSLVQTLQKS